MSKVWVQSVAPNNLHGFRMSQLSLLDLQDGLNVVFASNATGKSTLAKAIVSLFQPEFLDQNATVNGTVWNGGEFQSLAKRRKEAKFPGFPGRTKDYYLDLPSLLQGLGQDSQVEELLSSGYRFEQPVRNTQTDNSLAARQARDTLQQLKDARKYKQSVLIEEQRLPAFEQRVKESQEARANKTCLDVLHQHVLWTREKRRYLDLVEQLQELHPGLQQQGPAAAGELEQKVKGLARAERELGLLQREIQKAGGPERPTEPLREADIATLQKLIDDLNKTEALVKDLRQRSTKAAAAMNRERQTIFRLSPEDQTTKTFELTEDQFAKLSGMAAAADREREHSSRAEGLRRASQDWIVPTEAKVADLEHIQRLLLDWLDWDPAIEIPNNWMPVAALAAGAVVAAFLPSWPLRLVVALIAAAATLYWSLQLQVAEGPPRPVLSGLPKEFACPHPTVATVSETLNKVAVQRSQLQIAQKLELLSQSSDPPAEEWKSLAEELEFKCTDPYRLAILVDSAQRYVAAKREADQLETELDHHDRLSLEFRTELREFYTHFGFAYLPEREVECQKEFLTWIHNDEKQERLHQELGSLESEIEEFLNGQGVPSGLRKERIELFRERIPLAAQSHGVGQRVRDLDSKLGVQPLDRARLELLFQGEMGALESIDLESVDAEVAAQTELSSQLELRQQEWQELRTRIQHAEEGGQLSDIETKYRRALTVVEERYEGSCRASVKFRISEAIRERLMTEDLPPVLQRANEILEKFSRGRYRLEFARIPDEQLGVLTVADRSDGKKQPFKQLSSGTKVHALLSLRLALIDEQESLTSAREFKFPLVVDEAMAVSDPESSRAIAEALIHIAKERQVIVFTSQDSDVSLLQSLMPDLKILGLNREDLPVPTHVDSGLARTLLAPVSHAFDPRYPVGAHSVAAIFGDGETNGGLRIDQSPATPARDLLVKKLEAVRQDLALDYPRLEWAAAAEERWATTNFSSRLQEFLDECSGCPHRFLQALELHRGQAFNRTQVEAASEWLTENNYLVSPPELDTLAAVLKAAGLTDYLPIYAQAFIPHYIPGQSPTAAEPERRALARKARKQEESLFENLFEL